jgi:methylmalonyl-CoA mutase cobalamin-binding subunit
MFYGNTIGLGEDLERNTAISSSCRLVDILGQLRNNTAHAIVPVPKTEPIRIPSPSEVLEAQVQARQTEEEARLFLPLVSFAETDSLATKIVIEGKKFFESTLRSLREMGVRIDDPLELLMVLRKLGPHKLERMFGAGEKDERFPSGRKPVFMTDMTKQTMDLALKISRDSVDQPRLDGIRILAASTDVHEYPLTLITYLLNARGAEVINLGPSVESPGWLVDASTKIRPAVAVVTTHNGKALDYGRELVDEMKRANAGFQVVMGGVLNQSIGNEMPIDVTDELNKLGIVTSKNLEKLPSLLKSLVTEAGKR